jgi:EpsI family protein
MSRQGWVLSSLLLCTALFSHFFLYREITARSTEKLTDFPVQIGHWRMTFERPPTEREMELLETENIMTRVYRDDAGREVALVLVYDPSGNRKMAHPQEICLKADGMEALQKSSVAIRDTDISAERLLMERAGKRTVYYYWFKAGDYQSGSYIGSQLRLAMHSLSGDAEGTALIRMSSAATGDGADADRVLQDFAVDAESAFVEHLK